MKIRWPRTNELLTAEGLGGGSITPAQTVDRADASAISAAQEAKTHRRCVTTREILPKQDLLRFVLDGDRNLIADLDQRLPGRGAYLRPERAALEEALKKNLFARAFKGKISAGPDFLTDLQRISAQRVQNRLGLMLRAGRLTFGAENVQNGLVGANQSKGIKLYLHAIDAAENGTKKLAAKARATTTPMRAWSTIGALSDCLGRQNMAHIGVVDRNQAKTLVNEINRVEGLLGCDGLATAEFWAAFSGTTAPKAEK